ncbi:MAG: hypothetical protein R3C01_09380 [Planctomycetaceae bacterium]
MIHGHYYESSITCYMNRWIPSYNEAIKPVNSLFRKLKKWPFLFNLKTNKKCSWLMAPLTANAYSERNYAIVDGYEKFEVLWPEVKPRKPRQSKSPKAVKTKKSIPRRDPKMYYMRFFLLDGPPLSLDGITAALTARNASFSVKPLTSDSGNLFRDDELLGQLEVNLPGTDLADEELEEFRERVSKKGKGNKSRILAALDRVQAIVSLGILWQGRSTDDTLDMILPLWITLHKHGTGLLQADGEGFYDNTGDLIYEIR